MTTDNDWMKVYAYWFGEPGTAAHGTVRDHWFHGGRAADELIKTRFSETCRAAIGGRLEAWKAHPKGAVSLVVVLDQFPRNIFRGDPRSFAHDSIALAAARELVEGPFHDDLMTVEKLFAYLPFEHSENIEDQDRSVAMFEAMEPHPSKQEWVDFAVEHRDIILQFGRFPHRNVILGRDSTPEEAAWLAKSDQRFGTVAEDDT